MQNYGQAPGYQRPGSTTSFAGQQGAPPIPPPPPGYGSHQPYQSVAPQAHSQWASPTPTNTSNPWNQQPQQAMGGYNPGTYGTMPGAQQHSYPAQYQDQPPPPPPKPYGFAAAVQQQQQNAQTWSQQPQQDVGFTPHTQQGGYPVQGTQQQPYQSAAPPPPSATPGGSYFPPPQGGRPSSIYGASQAGPYPNAPPGGQQPPSVMSPNEQQPAYIPPSLTGHGVQAYMPSNTNPAPGVYVPPPPDIPAWQQAQHAPLQGGTKKFTYTKPMVDPSFYAQGYQGIQPMHQPPPLPPRLAQQSVPPQQPQSPYSQTAYGQIAHGQYPGQVQMPQQAFNQYPPQQQQGQFGLDAQTLQQPTQPVYGQAPYDQSQQQQPQYGQPPYGEQMPHPEQYPQPQNQWQPPPPPDPGYQHAAQPSYEFQQQTQQPSWQPEHQTQGSLAGQRNSQAPSEDIQAPKPFGRTDTAPSNFYNQPSPLSQPVSPVFNRPSVSSASGYHTTAARTESVSSIALVNLHAQRAENKTSSPKPSLKLPTPPPPRDDKSKFSVLGAGAPSDWEHFGDDEEIDDEELFGVKGEEKKIEAAQPDSVELPAHVPSPSSMHGWPSPVTHPPPSNSGGWGEAYAPTPPSVTTELASPQGFVVEEAIVAPLRTTPKPIHSTHPPAQGNLGTSSGIPSKQGTPVQPQTLQQAPPPQQGFVHDEGGWTTQSVPSHQQHQPISSTTGFVMHEGGENASQQTPSYPSGHWGAQPKDDAVSVPMTSGPNYAAELKAKDGLITQLRTESEREKNTLHAELDALKADNQRLQFNSEAAKTHATSEADVLHGQVETMRKAADQASANSDALAMEKGLTIERLKEDVEGKEHNIEERDNIIADLRRQLEAEKTKQPPRPAPEDLIPDIDPWYVGSLERYIAMLRSEAQEPEVEGKIKTFKAFLKAESGMRGINYYDTPPPVPLGEPETSNQPDARSRGASNASARRHDLIVKVPQDSSPTDDFNYSPGGRPILPRRPTLSATENVQAHPPTALSVQSTTILTPTSSVDDDSNKTPVQSPPEEQPQPQYKAYVPPVSMLSDSAPPSHRHTMSFTNVPAIASPSGRSNSKGHDEIFFGTHQPKVQKATGRPSSSEADIPVPAPLTLNSRRPASTVPAPARDDPSKILAGLLPSQLESGHPNHSIEGLRAKLASTGSVSDDVTELTKAWEKSASLNRRKLDDARRKRQEENEEHNDDRFNSDEISYAELAQLEDEFKQEEADLKAQEDKDEYKSYADAVFDPIFDKSQAEIKTLMDLYLEAERLLETSVTGVRSLNGSDTPSTQESLELLRDLHAQIEKRQENVIHSVAERDKRYKKTETQPLYATGQISKMKAVEKHFENAEKQVFLKAYREKAERIGDLVALPEDIVVDAVGTEQREIDSILAAIQTFDDGAGDPELLTRAHGTIQALKSSSKALLSLFNTLEIELNDAVIDAEIMAVKAEGSVDQPRLQGLEKEKVEGRRKMVEEFERRVAVLEQDAGSIGELVQRKIGKGKGKGEVGERKGEVGDGRSSEEVEKEKRLRMALEEAKRRNGDV